MQSDYPHISVILDRSGSMEAIRDDIIGGFNAYIARQQAQPGQATLTLVQFDHQDPYEVVHQFRALASVPRLDCETFVPRGRTPLLDAMARGMGIRVADSASFGLSSDEIFSSFDYVSLRSSDFRSSPRKPAPDPTPPDDSPA